MEHIRQSSQKHTSSSLNVTKHVTFFTPVIYQNTEIRFPLGECSKEVVPIYQSFDFSNLKEKLSQVSGVSGPGRYPTPGQSLSLDMNQTTLQYNTRPQLPEHFHHLRITVNRETLGAKASLYQWFKEIQQLWFGILRDAVLASYKRMGLGIHKRNKAMRTVQECPINEIVLDMSQVQSRSNRCLFQAVVDHMIKLPRTISALFSHLPDRITLPNPHSEPFLFIDPFVSFITPCTGVSAIGTEPTLFSTNIMTVFPKNSGAERTVFFYS